MTTQTASQYMAETSEKMASKLHVRNSSKAHPIFPARRRLPQDITAPKFGDLVDLALLRVLDAGISLETPPPRLFPTAETVFAKYYANEDWLNHGNLETEIGRMSYMLSNLPERSIPSECIPTIRLILSSASVLVAWKRTLPRLKKNILQEIRWVVSQMQKQQRENLSGHTKSRFLAVPVDYRTDATTSHYAIQLWENSLSEITARASNGHFEQAKTFLQVFAFLKDPLGGLEGISEKAVDLFVYMMTSLARISRQTANGPLRWHAATAQAAQEALFLSCPLLENISYIHFTGHQQLPYVYVALDQLPRSEFSIPEHVLRIVEEILTANPSHGTSTCPVAPIAVSSYPALPIEQGKHTTVIIDGNHRATAAMMLRLIAEHPVVLTTKEAGRVLDAFCADHKLGLKWKVDLAEVLNTLHNSHYMALIHENIKLVELFRHVSTIPALVVREDNFHTVCQQRPARQGYPKILLPIHQALYNDETLGFAFPQAGQVHGRAVGFKAMPLLRAEEFGDAYKLPDIQVEILEIAVPVD